MISLNTFYQMVNLIKEPTRVTETSASTIDLILSNALENILSSFKHFSDRDFCDDLSQVPWQIITTFSDPNEC